MTMLTETKLQRDLKDCVQEMTDEEKRGAIAYLMAISANQALFLQHPTPRLVEFTVWADKMQKQSTRDKMCSYFMQQLVPESKPKYRVRNGRYQGKLNS